MKIALGIFGVLLILGGIAIGIYVGVWLCFIKGIVGIINTIKVPGPVGAGAIAWDIIKVMFASTLGGLAGAIPAFIGKLLVVAAFFKD